VIRFVPIEAWPGTHTPTRRRSPFRAGYASTVRHLERELAAVKARNVVVQLALRADEIKRDGLPYANAKPAHPGVIVSFETPPLGRVINGKWTETVPAVPLSFPCDRFATWQENLRAIALALDALRRVDRYGVTRNAEQYRGWAKLPPPGGLVTPVAMKVDDASAFLARHTNERWSHVAIEGSADAFRSAYRFVAQLMHPDTNGGRTHPDWGTLQQAKAVLDKHHGQ